MKVEIEFVSDIVGHDIDTINQMYNDWSKTPNKNNDTAAQLLIELRKRYLIEIDLNNEPKADLETLSDLWGRVNSFLNLNKAELSKTF